MLDSYTKFKEYCLRALGQDEDKIIKVEVTEAQLKDRIEDALKKWQDFHFEGSTMVSLMKHIRASDLRKGYLEVPELNSIIEILSPNDSNKSNAEVMDDLEYRINLEYADNTFFGGGGSKDRNMMLTDYYITMEYLASMRYLFTADKLFTFNATSNRLILTGKYPYAMGGNLVEEFRNGNWDAGTGTTINADTAERPDGTLKATRLTNTDAGANPINASFTYETGYYPRGLRTFSVKLKSGTYTGRVRMRVYDRAGNTIGDKTVTPKNYWQTFEVEAYYKDGHINDYKFELESVDAVNDEYFEADSPVGYRNNFVLLIGYQKTDPTDVAIIWDSGWLKEYAIALIKRQWAQNLKKYDGIQMAGGVTLNAQVMYDEATADIERLNEDLETKWSLPPAIMIG